MSKFMRAINKFPALLLLSPLRGLVSGIDESFVVCIIRMRHLRHKGDEASLGVTAVPLGTHQVIEAGYKSWFVWLQLVLGNFLKIWDRSRQTNPRTAVVLH